MSSIILQTDRLDDTSSCGDGDGDGTTPRSSDASRETIGCPRESTPTEDQRPGRDGKTSLRSTWLRF